MNNQQLVGALAMDLKRISLGLQRESEKMTKKFTEEALQRCNEIDTTEVKPYIAKIINQIKDILKKPYSREVIENLLVYSSLLQNSL